MVRKAPAATTTAIVTPTTMPVARTVPRSLGIGLFLAGHREGHDDARAAALTLRNARFAAELHGEAADEGQPETSPHIRADRTLIGIDAVVLDHQLDLLAALVDRLDAYRRRASLGEIVAERAAHRLGNDQADRDRRIGADRHDRRTDLVTNRGPRDAGTWHGDLADQVADELLEIDQRPARPFVEMAMENRQGENAVLRVAEEAPDARRTDLARLQVEQARDHLQVVLNAMVNLAKHVIALLETDLQVAFAAGDGRRHLLDAAADGDQLLCPAGRRDEFDILSPRHATGKVVDIAQRAHAPAIGAQPGDRKDEERAEADQGEPADLQEHRRHALSKRHRGDGENRPTRQGHDEELVERAVLTVVAEPRLARGDCRGKQRRDRHGQGHVSAAADRRAGLIDQHDAPGIFPSRRREI